MKNDAENTLSRDASGRDGRQVNLSRRRFLGSVGMASGAALLLPRRGWTGTLSPRPRTRLMGRTGFEIATLGLGGQGAMQWTPEGIDPQRIVLKALDLGINYIDAANVYDDCQVTLGKVFRQLHLVPGAPGYDEKRRRSIWLNSKTYLRWGKGGDYKTPGITGGTGSSKSNATVVDDIKRTLIQVYGNGNEEYPEYPAGAYIDSFFMHSIQTPQDVAAVWEGFDNPDPKADRIGAMAVLRDYRDGTNLTGQPCEYAFFER